MNSQNNEPSHELLRYRVREYDTLAQKLSYLLDELYTPGEGDKKDTQFCNKCDAKRHRDPHEKGCFIGKLDYIVWWGVPR